jgi:hypothetical protein
MTDAPPARGTPARTTARAFLGGLGVSVLVAAIGQLAGLVLFLAQGANAAYAPYARLGAVYVALFHHVDVSARPRPAAAGAVPLSVHLGVALTLVTAVAVVLLALAGRRLAPSSRPGTALAVIAAMAGGYAVLPLVLAFAAGGPVGLPSGLDVVGPVDVGVSALGSFLPPFAIAAAAGALGALTSRDAAEPPTEVAGPRPMLDDVVLGGVRAFALGLVLSIVGLLVLASVQPSFLRAYLSVITAPDGATGRAVVAGHAVLLLPNQAMWVLVPAMGACDEAVVDGRATPFLCYSRMPTQLPLLAAVDAGIASPAFRTPPRWYLAFLLVPLVATLAGGIRAGRAAGSVRARAGAGAASGLVFAALVAVSIALVRTDLRVMGAFLGETVRVSIGPELLRGTGLAAAWGILGGVVGATASRYAGGRTGTIAE